MKNIGLITVLVLLIVTLSLPSTLAGILSNDGPGRVMPRFCKSNERGERFVKKD